ncbi:MAG: RpoL/Rpb11 RNA polymerase subunit family protein [Candidatus ainarchaeum sp.]|nr:RpoL/Rpb11 RNA polymerase subunit family protein [Candidatus ainarchaeum sp.]
MEVKVLLNEKNTLELELNDSDQSLGQLLAEKLSAEKDVEFAASKVEHPLVDSVKLIVKTKKGDPAKLVLEKLDEIKSEVSDFSKKFSDLSK